MVKVLNDKIRFRTSSGRVGELKDLSSTLTISYLEPFVDIALVLDDEGIGDLIRGWRADGSDFNGFHNSAEYGIRINLNKNESRTLTLNGVSAKSLLLLSENRIVSIDNTFTLAVDRADDPADEVTPTDSIDINIVTDSAASGALTVDSDGSINVGPSLRLGNIKLTGDSFGEFNIVSLVDGLSKFQVDTSNVTTGSTVTLKQDGTSITNLISNTVDDAYVKNIITAAYIQGVVDATYVKGIINSTYVQGIANSTYVQGIIDDTYVKNIVNSTYLRTLLIDSAFL